MLDKFFTKIANKVEPTLLLLLVLPWVIALSSNNWLFEQHSYIDSWIYLGFFLRFNQFLSILGDTYYASRLSVIIPGHIAFELFPPLAAQYILHVTFYYLAIISFYLTLKYTLNSRAAFLSTVMLGCYAWFHERIGSNYVDGFGIAYYLVTVLMLTLAAKRGSWRTFLVLGGFFYGCLIYSNLFWVVLTPSLAIYHLAANSQNHKSFLKSCCFFVIGFAVSTLLFGIISFTINGKFLFFLSSINTALSFLSVESVYRNDWSKWTRTASWLTLLVVTFVNILVFLVINFGGNTTRRTQLIVFSFQFCFALNLLIFITFDLLRRPTLQFDYYASYLIPSMFLAIGSLLTQLELTLERLKPYQLSLAVGGTILVTMIAYRLPAQSTLFYYQIGIATCFFSAVWLIYLGWALFCDRIQKIGIYAFLLLLLTFNAINAITITSLNYVLLVHSNFPDPDTLTHLNQVNLTQKEDSFLIAVHAQQHLKLVDPKIQLLFWYDVSESWIYRSIASMCLWRHLSENFPESEIKSNSDLRSISRSKEVIEHFPNIVILSKKQSVLEEAKQSLAKLGYNAELLSTHNMQQGSLSFRMTFIKASRDR